MVLEALMRALVVVAVLLLGACATGGRQYTCGYVPRDAKGQPVIESIGKNNC